METASSFTSIIVSDELLFNEFRGYPVTADDRLQEVTSFGEAGNDYLAIQFRGLFT